MFSVEWVKDKELKKTEEVHVIKKENEMENFETLLFSICIST